MRRLNVFMWCVIVALLATMVTLLALGCTMGFAATRSPVIRTIEKPVMMTGEMRTGWEPWEQEIIDAASAVSEAWRAMVSARCDHEAIPKIHATDYYCAWRRAQHDLWMVSQKHRDKWQRDDGPLKPMPMNDGSGIDGVIE